MSRVVDAVVLTEFRMKTFGLDILLESVNLLEILVAVNFVHHKLCLLLCHHIR